MNTFEIDDFNELPRDVPAPENYDLSANDYQIGVFEVIKGTATEAYFAIEDILVQSWKKSTYVDYVIAGVSCFAAYLLIYIMFQFAFVSSSILEDKNTNSKAQDEETVVEPLRDFTPEQLRVFDGSNDTPIYVALKREVFNVSSAAQMYGPGSSYACFAGREASRAMAKLSFEESELSNLNIDDLSPFDRDNLDGWVEKFKHYKNYPVIGKVSVAPSDLRLTSVELLQFNGKQAIPADRVDAPIYVSINRRIYDVSYGGREMYSEGCSYFLFAGKDVSRALAKMSFQPEDVNSLETSDLTPQQLKCLAEWEEKFSVARKYPCVGVVVDSH